MEVITLDYNSVLDKSLELNCKIKCQPDLIVGVLNGGSHLFDVVKSENSNNNIYFKTVQFRRSYQSKKDSLVFKKSVKLLPYSVSDRLRVLESSRAKKSIKDINRESLSNITLDLNLNGIKGKNIKRILIVDDAIDTGTTMFVVKSNLEKAYPNANIEIAVLTWTLKDSIVKPDYYIYKNVLVRFPWSKDYKEKDFEESTSR